MLGAAQAHGGAEGSWRMSGPRKPSKSAAKIRRQTAVLTFHGADAGVTGGLRNLRLARLS